MGARQAELNRASSEWQGLQQLGAQKNAAMWQAGSGILNAFIQSKKNNLTN